MPKRFITELDIFDLSRDGKQILEVDEDTVLTDLALEKIKVFGIQLLPRKKEPIKTLIQPVNAPAPLPVEKSPVVPTTLPSVPPIAATTIQPASSETTPAPEQKHAPCGACALKMKAAAESVAPLALDSRISGFGSTQSVLHNRIRSAIQAKLGNQIESEFIDKIIFRSLKAAGLE